MNKWEHRKHEWVQSRSFNLLLQLAGAGWGVAPMSLYTSLESLAGMEQIPKGVIPEAVKHSPLPFPGTKQRQEPGYQFQTILIDTPIFLRNLYNYTKKMGVTFHIDHRFNTLREVMSLEEKILFNTLGLGATVFGFKDLHPVRGDLLHFESDPNMTYMIFHGDKYIFPQKDKLVAGGSFKMRDGSDTPDPEKEREILNENRIWLYGQ